MLKSAQNLGEFTYDRSTEPSIFTGKLGDGIKETFKTTANDLHLAEIPEKTRGFIILILKKS